MSRAVLLPLLLLGVGLGVVGAFLVPLRVHGVLVPVSPVLAVVGNLAVGLLGARAAGSRAGAVLPALGWLAVVLVLGSSRPEGDLVLPGGSGIGYVALAFILLGAVAAAAGVGLGQPAARRAAHPAEPRPAATPTAPPGR